MQAAAEIQAPALEELVPLHELQGALSNIFPSMGSLQWHLKQHRDEYIEAGALFRIAGHRRLVAHPPTFKRVALQIGARAAARASL